MGEAATAGGRGSSRQRRRLKAAGAVEPTRDPQGLTRLIGRLDELRNELGELMEQSAPPWPQEEKKEQASQRHERGTVRVWPDAGRALGLGRNATYEAVARGEIPVLRFGRRMVVAKRVLDRLLDGQQAKK